MMIPHKPRFSNYDDMMWVLNYERGAYKIKHVLMRFV